MSRPDCSDVCEIVHSRLLEMGFEIDPDDEDHIDIIRALGKVVMIKDEDYSPECETVCSNMSAMLEVAGFKTDGEHEAILEALGKIRLVRTDIKPLPSVTVEFDTLREYLEEKLRSMCAVLPKGMTMERLAAEFAAYCSSDIHDWLKDNLKSFVDRYDFPSKYGQEGDE